MKKKLFFLVIGLIISSCSKDEPVSTLDNDLDNNIDIVTIGINGGQITSDDGIVTLIIPPNALKSETEITIVKVNVTTPINDPDIIPIGDIYKLSPSGLTFNTPIEVRIDYLSISGDFDLDALNILHWDDQNTYEKIGIIKLIGNKLSFNIDSFSFIQLFDFYKSVYKVDENYATVPWRNHNWRWNIPVIKWYLDENIPNSGLSLENVQYSLDLWDVETSSFRFERTNNINEANITFNEFYSEEALIQEASQCDDTYLAFFALNGYMCPNGNLDPDFTLLDEENQLSVLIASEAIWEERYVSVITHEIGHALGLGHLNEEDDYLDGCPTNIIYPIMSAGCFTSSNLLIDGNFELHEWDLMALHEHYEQPNHFTSEFFDLNDNQIPEGWTFISDGSGDINDGRINAYIVDGMGGLSKEALVSSSTTEIILELDSYAVYSYWGLKPSFELYAGDKYLRFASGVERFDHPANTLVYDSVYSDGVNPGYTLFDNYVPREDGIFHIKLVMNSLGYTFIGYDSGGIEIFNQHTDSSSVFDFTEIERINFRMNAHTDNSGWIDNLRITMVE